MLVRIIVVALCLTGGAFGQAGSSSPRRAGAERADVIATTRTVSASWTGVDAQPSAPPGDQREFRLLATNKTSTMQKEMNEAADAGFHFEGTMGGETSFGGSEVVVIMSRDPSAQKKRYEYKLLATSKTSTMQKEMNEAGAEGYIFVGVTVGETLIGGKEVVSILRRPALK